MKLLNAQLVWLRGLFLERKFDCRFVGGCVRDVLANLQPQDIDLCTDADPTQQEQIYKDNNIRYIATGAIHGTFTVILDDQTYEITSLRRDVSTDGRRATVAFTRNWIEDLARRDFTINAMQMTFDGQLIDPFNGQQDLANKVVRFVGNAERRIKEDYLRILRWFRFSARFSDLTNIDDLQSINAITLHMSGLKKISRERIWQEMSKILSGPQVYNVMQEMYRTSVLYNICFDDGSELRFPKLKDCAERTKNPITLLVAFLGSNAIYLLARWKCSNSEIQFARDLSAMCMDTDGGPRYFLAVNKFALHAVIEYCHLTGRYDNFDIEMLRSWTIPPWPVNGMDAMACGVPQGPQVKQWLNNALEKWATSDYTLTRDELM